MTAPQLTITGLTIDARRMWIGEEAVRLPLAFVDLDATRDWPQELALPPCPVVALGDPAHPLAKACDAVIEPPVSAEALMRQVLAKPHAAAVSVQLLRLLTGMETGAALTAESLAYGLLQGSAEHNAWLAARAPSAPADQAGQIAHARAGPLLTITLDRASSGNAIDTAMRDGLCEAFSAAALEPEVETVLLRAEGRSFSLGADLAEFGTTRDPALAHAIRMQTLPAPLIAACAARLEVRVQGACVGAGLEMAAWARQIVATKDAWFQLPELAMGLLPGAGGCVSLSRRIGRQRTALMLLSGRRISARIALGWGLVDRIEGDLSADQA